MRRILTASLFLSTVLLNAQTATTGQGVALEARSETPNALTASAAAEPATDATATPIARRISTGVTEPKLISEPAIDVAISDFNSWNLGSRYMVLRFKVDETGTPQGVEIIKAVSPDVDAKVLEAVHQFHFAPAKLDNQAIPMNLDMRINFQAQ
jgi:TonB family protein